MTETIVEQVTALRSAVGAMVAAVVVSSEYVGQQREKKTDRASEFEATLQQEPDVRLAALILDWGDGTLPLQEDLRAFTGAPVLTHDLDLLFKALRPELTKEIESSRVGMLYRIVFVALFNYLQRAVNLLNRGYIVYDNILQTVDLARQLLEWQYAELRSHAAADWFIPAMRAWEAAADGQPSLASCWRTSAARPRSSDHERWVRRFMTWQDRRWSHPGTKISRMLLCRRLHAADCSGLVAAMIV